MPLAPPVIRTTLSLSCKSMLHCLQSVKSRGIAAEDFLLVRFRESFYIALDELLYLAIARRQQAHRPVRTKHQSVCAEGVKDDVQVRPEVLSLPLVPIGFSDQPRHFAENIFVLRDLCHLRGPGSNFLGLDLRL